MGAPFILTAARRRRRGGGAAPVPPFNGTLPTLRADTLQENLIYTPGTWDGTQPIAVTARLFVDGVDVGAALPSMTINVTWRGKDAYVRETAVGAIPPVAIADSTTLTVPSTLTLDQQVAAVLAGKDGFAFDGRDITKVFQTGDTSTPVTAPGQEVRFWLSQWGAAQINAAANIGAGPAWSPDGLSFDNVDDFFNVGAGLPVGTEDFVATFGLKARAITTTNPILGIGFGSTTGGRFIAIGTDTSGRIYAHVRAGPAGPPETFLSANGVVPVGARCVVSVVLNYITGALVVRLDGVPVISATLSGTAGPLSSAPNRFRLGRDSNDATGYFDGEIFRWVCLKDGVSVAELEAFEEWVGQVPTLDQQVEAILAGTDGYALDPQDFSTMFQNVGETVPVTAVGNPVASIRGKWGSGGSQFFTGTAAVRPVLGGGHLDFDGVDDLLTGNAQADIVQAAPAAFICAKVSVSDLSVDRMIYVASATTAQPSRFGLQIGTLGGVQVLVRRPNVTGFNPNFSASPVAINTPVVLSGLADVAGLSQANAWVNGAADTPQALGAAAPFENTASARIRLGATNSNTPVFFAGAIGRLVVCPFVPTAHQRTVLEAWVSDGPFDPAPSPPPAVEPWQLPFDYPSTPAPGALVEHDGKIWRNTLAVPNPWEPGIFGWEAAT